jgi:hypothetical protein
MQIKSFMADLRTLGLVLQGLLLLVLFAKKAWSRFPFFFAYSAFTFASTCLLYQVISLRAVYFYTYWTCEGVSLLLGFAVVCEIFRTLLFSFSALRRIATFVFSAAIIVLLVLAVVVVYAQASSERNPLVAGILVAEEAFRMVELGLLMILFLFSTAFGLNWKQSVFGITLGLGFFTAVELVAVTVRTHLGVTAAPWFGLARAIAFNLSLFIWLGYLLAPEKVSSSAEVPKQAQLEQWNQAVMELISR